MDWKSLVGNVAPVIASYFGTPFAGMAIAAVSNALLGRPDGSEQDIVQVLTTASDPDMFAKLEKLKQADNDFKLQIEKLGIERDKINAGDRDSARNRQVALKDQTPARLAYIVIGGFLSVTALQLVALMFWPDQAAKIPSQGWLLIGNVSGYLANEAKQAGAYFFGSSSGSAAKNDMMAEAIKGK